MKKIINKLYIACLIITMGLFAACTPDSFELGEKDITVDDLVENIAFSITHDSENPNIVYLKSLMPTSYQVCWEHPQGRSQEREVTLQIPFEGEYSVKFGVQTRGGLVYGNPTTFTVESFCAEFVNDELWTLLSGGVGKSKTWYLDINADGVCKYFSGPMYFYGTDDDWETVTLGLPGDGTDHWSWAADWAGNGSWLFGDTGAMDYGSMTFDLIDGANVTVNDLYNGTVQKGTYLIDSKNHTMVMTDAGVLHDPGRDAVVTQWGNVKILSLTEDYMQLGVIRDNDPNEGPCLLCYNFISKEYSDNWTPEDLPDPEPTLPDGWEDMVSEVVTSKIKWTMSPDVPYDWAGLDGSLLNNFTAGSYPDWAGPIAPNLDKLSLTLDSQNMTFEYETPDGNKTTGSYTLDEKGIYTFDTTLPSYIIGSTWVNFSPDANNQLRILSIESASGKVIGMWLGARSSEKDEYMAYHFIPNTGSSNDTPEMKAIAVDNSKIVFGNLETGKNNFRIELYNEYGETKSNSPIDITSLVFDYSMELKFTISGLTGDAATKEYNAGLMCTGSNWWPQYSGTNDVKIKGDGTYTINMKAAGQYNGVIVFVIDIFDMFSDISDPESVQVTIDSLKIL